MKRMKNLMMLVILLIGIQQLSAQSTNSKTSSIKGNCVDVSPDYEGPRATVTFKTQSRQIVSPLIKKINEFTNQDHLLTEKVIIELRSRGDLSEMKILKDADYLKLSEKARMNAIKESEVIEIINNLK